MLTMASKFRYVDDVIRAEEPDRVRRRSARSSCSRTPSPPASTWRDRWNSNPAVSGGGVLIDNGTHSRRPHALLPRPARRGAGRRGQARPGARRSRTPCASSSAAAAGVMGTRRPVVEHQQGTRQLPEHLRLARARCRSAGRSRSTGSTSARDWVVFGDGLRQGAGVPRRARRTSPGRSAAASRCSSPRRRARVGRGDRGGLPLAARAAWTGVWTVDRYDTDAGRRHTETARC